MSNKSIAEKSKCSINVNWVKESTKEYKITEIEKGKTTRPPFLMISSGRKGRFMNIEPINTLDVVMSFTDKEKFAFRLIMKQHEPKQDISGKYYSTNKFDLDRSKLSNTEKAKLSKGLGLLIKKDLLKKIGRSSYFMNPLLIQPTYIDEELEEYLSL